MTSDPQRLLQGTSSDDDAGLEHDLLRAIADVSPPAHAEGAAWEGIATKLAAISTVAAGATVAARAASATAQGAAATNAVSAPATSGLAHALAGKIVLGTIVAAGAVAAVGAWVHFADRPAKAPSRLDAPRAVMTTSPVVPVAPNVESPPEPAAPSPAITEAPSAVRSTPRQHPDDGLALEGALLTDARARLRAGDPSGVLAVLRGLDRQFPRGALRQEREVLAIEALSALGDTAAARRRADAFVKAHPDSPHSPLLHRLTSPP